LRKQIEVAHHRHQQIVEIVRDAAGQLADGLHLLGLAQLLLRLSRGGHRLHQIGRTFFDALLEGCGQFRQRRALGRQLCNQFSRSISAVLRAVMSEQTPTSERDAAVGRAYRRARTSTQCSDRRARHCGIRCCSRAPARDARDASSRRAPIVGMNRRSKSWYVNGSPSASEKRDCSLPRLQVEVGRCSSTCRAAGRERGLQQASAFRQIGKDRARLILPAPAAHRGADDAHQRGRMKRPLEERDVAQRLPESARHPDYAPDRRPDASAARSENPTMAVDR
jgi:hypothetical protein